MKIVTFIFFLLMPLWFFLVAPVVQNLWTVYNKKRLTKIDCIIRNGINKTVAGEYTMEIECKNGKKDGVEKTYFNNGRIYILRDYKNGVEEGRNIIYNKDGTVNAYWINNKGKSKQIYRQLPEHYISGEFDDGELGLGSQKFFCNNQEKYLSANYSYICIGDVMDGEFIKKSTQGNVLLKANFKNGVLDGDYDDMNANGKPYIHLEFKNGVLNGEVYQYQYTNSNVLEYEGHYTDGLQNGVFRRYDHKRIVSEVVFENSEIKQINIQ